MENDVYTLESLKVLNTNFQPHGIDNRVTICESPSAFVMRNGDVSLSGGRFKICQPG